VLVDDLIGSGEQASEMLAELDAKAGGLLRKQGVKTVFVVLAGFASAERRLEETLATLQMEAELHVCDPLGDEDCCFGPKSSIFQAPGEREEARGIAESHGKRLQRRQPLGYRDTQATVVFEESCPNSSLPILWDGTGGWRPLFPRH
jgi:hypothetical protein